MVGTIIVSTGDALYKSVRLCIRSVRELRGERVGDEEDAGEKNRKRKS